MYTIHTLHTIPVKRKAKDNLGIRKSERESEEEKYYNRMI